MASETVDPKTLVHALRNMESQIPHYRQLTQKQSLAIRRAATLSEAWINVAVNAAGESKTVQSSINATYEDLRQEMEEIPRWEEVEAMLKVLLKGVSAANVIRRHRVGLKALQIYGICRQLVRQPEHADLIPYVEKMIEMNKLGKRKKKDVGDAKTE